MCLSAGYKRTLTVESAVRTGNRIRKRHSCVMDERRRIKLSFLLMQVLQFTAVAVDPLYITVRDGDGDDVTLSCKNVMTDQDKCDRTSWIFSRSRKTETIELIRLGQIGEKAKPISDRLNVTADCSLVIKKVTVEDAGRYDCQLYDRLGRQLVQHSQVDLSVVNMTEHKDSDKVKLNCSVSTYGRCRHTVRWLFEDKVIDNSKDLNTSSSTCLATLTSSQSFNTSKNRASFKCEVTDTSSKNTTLFPLIRQSSAGWRWYVIVALVLAVLLVTVVVLLCWKMMKAKKEKMGDNIELTRNSAVTPETSQVTIDPEDGVSYATVSYTKKANGKARVQRKRDEDVTYSTVKASSSSAGASNYLSNHY